MSYWKGIVIASLSQQLCGLVNAVHPSHKCPFVTSQAIFSSQTHLKANYMNVEMCVVMEVVAGEKLSIYSAILNRLIAMLACGRYFGLVFRHQNHCIICLGGY